ncbi:MAG: SCO1664 family protein [Dehalococcoidia bacterium]
MLVVRAGLRGRPGSKLRGRSMAGLPSNPWLPVDASIVGVLQEADFDEIVGTFPSSNVVFLAWLSHPERGRGLAVYKPTRGERPLNDFEYGTLHHREAAAFEFSRLLGWDLVPPTVTREGPRGEGSVQLFISHEPREHYFVLREEEALEEQLIRLAVFDLVANNADRKGGHVLRDASGRLWGIDNGLTFHREEKLRTVIWDYAGTEIPAPLLADLDRVARCIEGRDETSQELRRHLGRREPEALLARIGELAARPVLPEMYPWRCTPWPLV